jgi:hypothetical protein
MPGKEKGARRLLCLLCCPILYNLEVVANFNGGDIGSRIRFLDGAVGEMLNLEACFPAVAEHVAYADVISELECR